MIKEDIAHIESKQEYNQECDICTMTMTVIGDNSEDNCFYQYVHVQCHCGNFIEFRIPCLE